MLGAVTMVNGLRMVIGNPARQPGLEMAVGSCSIF
jgi:hypothetical protein